MSTYSRFFCIPFIVGIVCPNLEDPNNGMVALDNSDRGLGTIANYSCSEGLVLNGSDIRICQVNGWNGTEPHCTGKKASVTRKYSTVLVVIYIPQILRPQERSCYA